MRHTGSPWACSLCTGKRCARRTVIATICEAHLFFLPLACVSFHTIVHAGETHEARFLSHCRGPGNPVLWQLILPWSWPPWANSPSPTMTRIALSTTPSSLLRSRNALLAMPSAAFTTFSTYSSSSVTCPKISCYASWILVLSGGLTVVEELCNRAPLPCLEPTLFLLLTLRLTCISVSSSVTCPTISWYTASVESVVAGELTVAKDLCNRAPLPGLQSTASNTPPSATSPFFFMKHLGVRTSGLILRSRNLSQRRAAGGGSTEPTGRYIDRKTIRFNQRRFW